MYLAASFSVTGAHQIIILIAGILFVLAAVIAWVVAPRNVWAITVAAGLAVYMLALLFR